MKIQSKQTYTFCFRGFFLGDASVVGPVLEPSKFWCEVFASREDDGFSGWRSISFFISVIEEFISFLLEFVVNVSAGGI